MISVQAGICIWFSPLSLMFFFKEPFLKKKKQKQKQDHDLPLNIKFTHHTCWNWLQTSNGLYSIIVS